MKFWNNFMNIPDPEATFADLILNSTKFEGLP